MANPLRGEVWLVDLGMVANIRPVFCSYVFEAQNTVSIPHAKFVHRLGR